MPPTPPPIASGAHVVIRDAVWRVVDVTTAATGERILDTVGVDEVVKGHRGTFVYEAEPDVEVLDPAETRLVPDGSPQYRASLLYVESHLRAVPPPDAEVHVGDRAALDVLPYQREPARLALGQLRPRILIADTVGLGKTLEAGILLAELIRRGRARRILVVTTKAMLVQFQRELWTRFTIPLVRLDSVGLHRVRASIPSSHNPFHFFDRAIVSMDTLKQNNTFRAHLEEADWDVIVIDEAHNVAERGAELTHRARLAATLSKRSDALILLSATPHDGRARSFASLMNMLDPTAIANPDDYGKDDIRGLFIRRFKAEVATEVAQHFPERDVAYATFDASPAEEAAFAAIERLEGTRVNGRSGGMLFRTALEKALLSSPVACLQTVRTRIGNLGRDVAAGRKGAEWSAEIDRLRDVEAAVAAIGKGAFTRYGRLVRLLTEGQGPWRWSRTKDDRLVVFTERIETLKFLAEHLPADAGLAANQIAVLHGSLSDVEQNQVVQDFGTANKPVRLLICSDVASEGINLHFLCHRLVHFDLPWSLMVFQQRNGRIDRYGQEQKPLVQYLQIASRSDRVSREMRVLAKLREKDTMAARNIADPSAFAGAYDVDEQEAKTAEAIEQGLSDDAFDALLASLSPMDRKLADAAQRPWAAPGGQVDAMPSLFASPLAHLAAALDLARAETPFRAEVKEADGYVEIEPPDDLRGFLAGLPAELGFGEGQKRKKALRLTASVDRMQRALRDARSDEAPWPEHHYLWPLHPVFDWVDDRARTRFGRHAAPALVLHQGLDVDETAVVVSGLVPNRQAQPVLHRWYTARFAGTRSVGLEPFEATMRRVDFRRPLPALDATPYLGAMKARLREAVGLVRDRVVADRRAMDSELKKRLDAYLERIAELEQRRRAEIPKRFTRTEDRRAEERRVDEVFEDVIAWANRALTTEPVPYLQVIAVLHRPGRGAS